MHITTAFISVQIINFINFSYFDLKHNQKNWRKKNLIKISFEKNLLVSNLLCGFQSGSPILTRTGSKQISLGL